MSSWGWIRRLTSTTSGFLMAIPFFGPFVAWAPPVIVAAVTKPDALFATIAIMGIGWFLVQNVLQPRILAGAIGLHPVVVLAAVLIGTKLFGVAGAIFGLPIAAVISSFFFYFLRRNVNPDERSVAARAAQRLAERDGRPKRVPREPKPGEAEEIAEEDVAGRATRRGRPSDVGDRTARASSSPTTKGSSRAACWPQADLEPLGEVVVIAQDTNQSPSANRERSGDPSGPAATRPRLPAWRSTVPVRRRRHGFWASCRAPSNSSQRINHGANLGDDITTRDGQRCVEAVSSAARLRDQHDDFAPDDFELAIEAARVVARAILARGLCRSSSST